MRQQTQYAAVWKNNYYPAHIYTYYPTSFIYKSILNARIEHQYHAIFVRFLAVIPTAGFVFFIFWQSKHQLVINLQLDK